jgi:hypothetical protein
MNHKGCRELKAASAAVIAAALALFLSACSVVQGDVQAGRQDLLYGDSNRALVHF